MKRRIGISEMKIQGVYALNDLGYDPVSIMGCFRSPERPVEIAQKHPNLHVISGTEGTYVNYFEAGHEFYYLSAGDADPDIEIYAEAFTEESLQRLMAYFKGGDKREITDPFDLAAIRFFSGFVGCQYPQQAERDAEARAKAERLAKN